MSRCRLLRRNAITDDQALDNLKEQAEILAMAGVDFMMVESTGNLIQRIWVSEACASIGLPMWTGFKVHKDEGDPKVKIAYFGSESLSQALQEVIPMGASVITVFHSGVEETDEPISIVKDHWSGPIAAYPESGRRDYVDRFQDVTSENEMNPDGYLEMSKKWVARVFRS